MENSLTNKELELMNAYWRACNYLSVGMIYLKDNPARWWQLWAVLTHWCSPAASVKTQFPSARASVAMRVGSGWSSMKRRTRGAAPALAASAAVCPHG